jgi:hypothetical protein
LTFVDPIVTNIKVVFKLGAKNANNNYDETQNEIRTAKRISLWLMIAGGLCGLAAVLVIMLAGEARRAVVYAMPIAMFAAFFLFLAGLHYVTGVWSVRKHQN